MTIHNYNFPFDRNSPPLAPILQLESLEDSGTDSGNPDFFLNIPLDLSVLPETPVPQPKAPPASTTAVTVATLARADAIRGILAGTLPIGRQEFSESSEWKKCVTITHVKLGDAKPSFSIQLSDEFFFAMHAHVLKKEKKATWSSVTHWIIGVKPLGVTSRRGLRATTILQLKLPAALATHPYLLKLTEYGTFQNNAKANEKLKLALQTFYDNILAQAPEKYFAEKTNSKSNLYEYLPLDTYIENAIIATRAAWDAANQEPLEEFHPDSGSSDFFLTIPLDLSALPPTPDRESDPTKQAPPIVTIGSSSSLSRKRRVEERSAPTRPKTITVATITRLDSIRGFLAGTPPISHPESREPHQWTHCVEIIEADIDSAVPTFTMQLSNKFLAAVHADISGSEGNSTHPSIIRWFTKFKPIGVSARKGPGSTTILQFNLPAALATHPYLVNLIKNENFQGHPAINKTLRLALRTFYDNILTQVPETYFSLNEPPQTILDGHKNLNDYTEKSVIRTRAAWDAAMSAPSSSSILATEREEIITPSSPSSSLALDTQDLFFTGVFSPSRDKRARND